MSWPIAAIIIAAIFAVAWVMRMFIVASASLPLPEDLQNKVAQPSGGVTMSGVTSTAGGSVEPVVGPATAEPGRHLKSVDPDEEQE